MTAKGAQMTIGDFAQATRLSAKALRFYHQQGVLVPASIDPGNGYRMYDADQVQDAQVVRQLRILAVPVATIRDILGASTVSARNSLISAHLERLEEELAATGAAVSTLRGLLAASPSFPHIAHRTLPATTVVCIREVIDLADLDAWYRTTLTELHALTAQPSCAPTGPFGGTWATDLFLHERGEAALFYPIHPHHRPDPTTGRAHAETLPAVDLAVATHRGPDTAMATTYANLGIYVASHELGVSGPIRETYLHHDPTDPRRTVTEVGWPIFRATR